MKIVVSFTTIPSRIKYIKPVIESLLSQSTVPDEIHIQISEYSVKEKSFYKIPVFLSKYEKVKLKIHKKDFGSANKWLYPIQYLKEEKGVLLVITDDDCVHDSDCIKTFLYEISQNSNICFCYSGGLMSRNPEVISRFKVANKPVKNSLTIIENSKISTNVDTVQGFAMFALKPDWFLGFDFSIFHHENTHNYSDDILISGVLEYLKKRRIQLAPYKCPIILDQASINPIHGEGRLLILTLNGIEFIKEKLKIWENINCKYPKRRPIYLRILSSIKKEILKVIK